MHATTHVGTRYVTYLRVSTDRQGRSGLGLEAQRAACVQFAGIRGGEILGEYVEVESGRSHRRPQLAIALDTARTAGATLLIAKIDRLARNVRFIAELLEGKVEIQAADMPEANRFLLHVMSAVAEHEAKAISDRTKAALAAARARGVKLGWSNPARRTELMRSSRAGASTNAATAACWSAGVAPIIQEIRETGVSLRATADTLNERGIRTARGGRWHPATVRIIELRHACMHPPTQPATEENHVDQK